MVAGGTDGIMITDGMVLGGGIMITDSSTGDATASMRAAVGSGQKAKGGKQKKATAHCSLLTAHCPLLTAHYSLLTRFYVFGVVGPGGVFSEE